MTPRLTNIWFCNKMILELIALQYRFPEHNQLI